MPIERRPIVEVRAASPDIPDNLKVHRAHERSSQQALNSSKLFNVPKLKCRQCAQGDFAVRIVDIVQRFGRQGDFHTQVGLMNRRDARIERAVRVAVIDVLNVGAPGSCTLLHQRGKQVGSRNDALCGYQGLARISYRASEVRLGRQKTLLFIPDPL